MKLKSVRILLCLGAGGACAVLRVSSDRRAHVPPARRCRRPDRVRLRRRHLARAEGRRRRRRASARRPARNRSRASRPTARSSPTAPTTTATPTSTSSRRRAASRSRLTHHPMADRVIGWHPDGKRVLFASGRESGRQRYNQFYLVGLDGGLPEKLPVPYGEFGAFSPDGDAVRLHADVAGLPQLEALSRRLGARPLAVRPEDVRVDATSPTTRPTTRSRCGTATRSTSSRIAAPSERNNIWAEDVGTGAVRQVTQFNDFDITFPSIGPDAIVFQAGGRLYLLEPADREVDRGPDPRRHRRDDAAAAHREGRRADQRARRCRRPASARCSRRAATSSRVPAERGAGRST